MWNNDITKPRVFQLDAFATPKLKKDFEKLKADCEEMKNERSALLSEIDVLRARCVSMEERLEVEREDHHKTLDQLRDECKSYVISVYFLRSFSRAVYVYTHKYVENSRLRNSRVEKRLPCSSYVRRETSEKLGQQKQSVASGYYSLCCSRDNERNCRNVGARHAHEVEQLLIKVNDSVVPTRNSNLCD